MVKARSSNLFLCCFVFSLFQHCFALNIYACIVLFWLLFTRQISRLSIHSNQKSCYIVLVVLLESHLCLLFWSSAWKSESFSLWHLYLWKVNWWQVFSNKKCLCKLMMIIWYAMPCYYHVITMLKLLIFTWHLIYDCILWYWPCLYYSCIWLHCKFPVRIKSLRAEMIGLSYFIYLFKLRIVGLKW